ncbi:MFS transporter [Streptomyces polyrhachis]|uniref:MFS transporter n=1 Tax=Streptomyces polyrhachis TaxID=1282885 RepID=A0ABW2GI99_9ACTN
MPEPRVPRRRSWLGLVDGLVDWLRGVLLRPVPASLLLAGVLHLLWLLFFANSGGDLAAQDAWAEFAGRHPDSAYNLSWYGGMHPVSYSVISPYLMAVCGVRTTMIVVGTLSAGLLALIVTRSGVRRPLAPSLWGAFALTCNAGSGRVTFGLGLLLALGAVAVVFPGPREWSRWRLAAVALLSALATAASPVAGLFLMVVAAALLLRRRTGPALAMAVPPPVVVGLSAWIFPFAGTQPLSLGAASVPLACTVAVYVLAPPQWRTVRLGAAVYALGIVATWLIPTQIGSNVERLSLIFGGTVLLAAAQYRWEHRSADGPEHGPEPGPADGPEPGRGRWWTSHRTRRLVALWLAFAGIAFWQGLKPVQDTVLTTPHAAWTHELSPLVHRLNEVDAELGRVEVVPVRSHREASALVPYVNLARGWTRQADLERHPLFYDDTLTPATYRAWLKRWAVRYVVLPVEDRPDVGAKVETKLVAAGLPYLTEIWTDSNWRLFRVQDPTPLAGPFPGPSTVKRPMATAWRTDESELTVRVEGPGEVLVRVPYSPWLTLVDAEGEAVEPPQELDAQGLAPGAELPAGEWSPEGTAYLNRNGCLREAGNWTRLSVPRAGTYRIDSPYRLPRGTACPD